MLKINGKQCDYAGMTISEILELEHYEKFRVAVERNQEIIPKAQYDFVHVQDQDQLEVVSFVGGG